MTPTLSILIISYNTRDMTLACLRSLYAQTTQTSFEVLLVDNASADHSAQAIAAEFPQVRLFPLQSNLGFAAANNFAAQHAAGGWILLLNPDTLVLNAAVDKLVAFAQSHPAFSIFGGRTTFGDGSLNPASCWQRPTLWNVFCVSSGLTSLFPNSSFLAPEHYGGWKRDSVREVDMVSGCFFLLPRKLWNDLHGFDPAFFMYGEEADLCLRARKAGARCIITPDAAIVHYGGASEAVRADKMVKLFVAKAHLFRRHWSPVAAFLGRRLLDFWAFSRMSALAVLSLLQSRRRPSFQTWKAIWSRRAQWHAVAVPPAPAPSPLAVGAVQP